MARTISFILNHPLNRNKRLAALLRFARWQLSARLAPGPVHVPFVNETVLVSRRRLTGATGNWYCGLHEFSDMGFVLHALRSDDLFVDIGANIGSYTVLAAGAVGARCVAFEPVPVTFALLEMNIRVNDLQVTAMNVGIGDAPARLRFSSGLDTTNHVLRDDESLPYVEIAVDRLDSLLNGQIPRIIKIDVEGWEIHVLRGAPETLSAPGLAAIVMETNTRSPDGEAAIATLRGHGFSPFSYDPLARRLIPGGTDMNTIFIRDRAWVEDRLRTAPRFTLVNGVL